jgi:hypothetical protein
MVKREGHLDVSAVFGFKSQPHSVSDHRLSQPRAPRQTPDRSVQECNSARDAQGQALLQATPRMSFESYRLANDVHVLRRSLSPARVSHEIPASSLLSRGRAYCCFGRITAPCRPRMRRSHGRAR